MLSDVEPCDDPRSLCRTDCSDSECITCESCAKSCHMECCGVVHEDCEMVRRVIKLIGWSCSECRQVSIKVIRQLKEDLQKNNEITSGPNQSQVISAIGFTGPGSNEQDAVSKVREIATSTIVDMYRRRRNVIISDLLEHEDIQQDKNAFVSLCTHQLGLNPKVISQRDLGNNMLK